MTGQTNSENNNGDYRKRCSNTEKWRRDNVNVNVWLLTSHILNVIFTFAPLGGVLKMYEDTRWHNVILDLKQFFG